LKWLELVGNPSIYIYSGMGEGNFWNNSQLYTPQNHAKSRFELPSIIIVYMLQHRNRIHSFIHSFPFLSFPFHSIPFIIYIHIILYNAHSTATDHFLIDSSHFVQANARTPYRLMSNPGSTRTVPETPAMAGTPARGGTAMWDAGNIWKHPKALRPQVFLMVLMFF
jgi:hypothetical protein